MLTAYFDDSGTHDGSEVVVMGGLIGDEAQWAVFECAWKAKLAEPLPGKPALKRFHMVDCEVGAKEFADYSRPERDAIIHDFRRIILAAKLPGFAIAVSRPDWDRVIIPPRRQLSGDAEQYCFANASAGPSSGSIRGPMIRTLSSSSTTVRAAL